MKLGLSLIPPGDSRELEPWTNRLETRTRPRESAAPARRSPGLRCTAQSQRDSNHRRSEVLRNPDGSESTTPSFAKRRIPAPRRLESCGWHAQLLATSGRHGPRFLTPAPPKRGNSRSRRKLPWLTPLRWLESGRQSRQRESARKPRRWPSLRPAMTDRNPVNRAR